MSDCVVCSTTSSHPSSGIACSLTRCIWASSLSAPAEALALARAMRVSTMVAAESEAAVAVDGRRRRGSVPRGGRRTREAAAAKQAQASPSSRISPSGASAARG